MMRDKIKKNNRGHKDIFMQLSLKSPFALKKKGHQINPMVSGILYTSCIIWPRTHEGNSQCIR